MLSHYLHSRRIYLAFSELTIACAKAFVAACASARAFSEVCHYEKFMNYDLTKLLLVLRRTIAVLFDNAAEHLCLLT